MRALAVAMSVGAAVALGAHQEASGRLATVLQRAGERVERYFTRAQSIVCLEVVRLLPLSAAGEARVRENGGVGAASVVGA